MVTDGADRDGVVSRKDLFGDGRWVLASSRQQILVRYEQVQGSTPGSQAASSLTLRLCDNQEDPAVGVPMGVRPWTSEEKRGRG